MRSRKGLGVLAVCGLVLGLMAISASGAQAAGCTAGTPTAKPCWMVGGANVTAELKLGATLTLEGEGSTLLTTSGKNAIAITCTTATVTEAALLAEGKGKGKINFSNCTTKVNGTVQSTCKPTPEPIESGGTFEIVLHEGVPYAKLTGTGGTFATITFSAKCLLIEAPIVITGTGWIKDCNGKFEEELVTHLIEEATIPAAALGGLLFGKNKASIDGSGNLSLAGTAHEGKKFSGLAD